VPVVTALRATRRGRIALHVDGEFVSTVSEALIARHHLFAGKELSAAELEALRAEASAARVQADAYRLLGHRSRSRAELRRRLLDKGHEAPEVDEVLDRLAADGLLDDAAFARAFATDKRRLAGWGSERIARALAEAGVADEHVREALSATAAEGAPGAPAAGAAAARANGAASTRDRSLGDSDGGLAARTAPDAQGELDADEAELARALAALGRRGRATPPLEAARARAFQFLRRRGYATHVAYDAVRRWSSGASEPARDE
jgi:regulatory protein